MVYINDPYTQPQNYKKMLNLQQRCKFSQGWRMRFNSNSVKNSPDYVK